MKNIFNEINYKNEILIADGATGTNYFDDGLQAGDPPELWNIEKSQSVIELHRKIYSGRRKYYTYKYIWSK